MINTKEKVEIVIKSEYRILGNEKNMNIENNHYKEVKPFETVAYLKGKLDELGIEVEEILPQKSEIGTNSLRVVFKGTNIGTNGKGINEEFCKASAYAELFERFENDYLNTFRNKNNDFEFEKCPDERMLSISELVRQNDPYLNYYFQIRGMSDISVKEKEQVFGNVNYPDFFLNENKYLCMPFYDVRSDKVSYLPSKLYSLTYGSNGMAAGNTPEEAIVQGLAEIIERVVQKELIQNPQSLPTVPDEYIKKYDYVYKRYKRAQQIKGLKVIMKDCSLSGKYPVAGLLIIDENTGKFGLKLGCHPDFGIAMERTLTEATQGGEINCYAHRSSVDFSNKSVDTKNNIMNSFATGLAQYPYQILAESDSKKFVKIEEVVNKNNKELMKEWIGKIIEDGYDVLIRDVSWLKFPAYHIIIPGLSEMTMMTDDYIRVHNTMQYAISALKTPESVKAEECKYIIAAIGYFKGNVLLDNIKHFFPNTETNLPFGGGSLSTRYLAAICEVYCGDYVSAYQKLVVSSDSSLIKVLNDNDKNRYVSECMYLAAYNELGSHEQAMSYMKQLLDSDMYNLIEYIYCEPKKVIEKVYSFNEVEGSEALIMREITLKLKTEMKKCQLKQDNLAYVFK